MPPFNLAAVSEPCIQQQQQQNQSTQTQDTGWFSAASDSTTTANKSICLTPGMVLEQHRDQLSNFEAQEIIQFPAVFWFGQCAHKVHASPTKPMNCGYDDIKGHYRFAEHDHIGYRYELLSKLGSGTFGTVLKAVDHKTGEFVAIKIIRNELRYFQQGLEEVKLLHFLKENQVPNVIQLQDSFEFRNHLCLVFELLEGGDVYASLRKMRFAAMPLPRIRAMATEIVQCLAKMHALGIAHRDLKPENIMIVSPLADNVKVIDFGLSGVCTGRVHSYIQSRYYRAPEVILKHSNGPEMDMWSLGCMLSELLTGKPLFPGKDEREQLMYQVEMFGLPPSTMLASSLYAHKHFRNGVLACRFDKRGKLHEAGSRSLTEAIGEVDPALFHLISRCLEVDPDNRITASQALEHPFLTSEFDC